MTALGKKGVKEMAVRNIQKAHYARKHFKKKGIEIVFESPIFNEFVIKLNKPVNEVNQELLKKESLAAMI